MTNPKKMLLVSLILLCLQSLTAVAQGPASAFPVLNLPHLESRSGENDGLRLFLNLLRLNPALLQDELILKHFIAVNNCNNSDAMLKAFDSEFDSPKIMAFYKAKAPEILNEAPSTIQPMIGPFYLGQYDAAKRAFPFVDPTKKGATITIGDVEPQNDLQRACVAGGLFFKQPFDPFHSGAPSGAMVSQGLTYRLHFNPVTLTELPMDEASAQKYVASLPNYNPAARTPRIVFLLIDMEILQEPAKLDIGREGALADFHVEVKKLSVVHQGNRGFVVIGVLPSSR
jgi:hypothetical protein